MRYSLVFNKKTSRSFVTLALAVMVISCFLSLKVEIAHASSFGYSTIGGSSTNFNKDYVTVGGTNLIEAGIVTSMSAYCHFTSGNGYVRLGIYSDNGASYPAAIEVLTNEVLVSTTAQWYNFTLTPTPLAAGSYWFGINHNGTNTLTAYWTAGGAYVARYKASTYPAFPDPFGVGNDWTDLSISIYADYVPIAQTTTLTDLNSYFAATALLVCGFVFMLFMVSRRNN